ncbi:MAG: hypothetical protein HYU67_04865 [Flavobacteriia bacterium]|nr:hypothetical protein [Flavobacteriia bacterium]
MKNCIVTIILAYSCIIQSVLFSQVLEAKIAYQVYDENREFKYEDSVMVKFCGLNSIDYELFYSKRDSAEIVELNPGDSLFMFINYPLGTNSYKAIHSTYFDEVFFQVPIYSSNGQGVIRLAFDTLTVYDTLLVILSDSGPVLTNPYHCYFFKIQFKENVALLGENKTQKLMFYPNPSSGFVYHNSKKKLNFLSLKNVLGQTQLINETNPLDLSLITNGTYYLWYELEDKLYCEKIVLIK